MKLFKVILQKHDSCYTYALKRIGKYSLWEAYHSAEEFLEQKVDLKKVTSVSKGDVLVKIKDAENRTYEVSTHIDEDGKILWKDVALNLHFIVCESDEIYSEAVLDTDSGLMEIQRAEITSSILES